MCPLPCPFTLRQLEHEGNASSSQVLCVRADFFTTAGSIAGVNARPVQKDSHVYRVGRVPRTLLPIGERLESRFGKLGRDYQKVVFDKALLTSDPTLEWVTPGHPLFEAVREEVGTRVMDDLRRGAVFYDLHAKAPYRLDVFGAPSRTAGPTPFTGAFSWSRPPSPGN